MSGTDPPPMPGAHRRPVRLAGPAMDEFIATIDRLLDLRPVIIGGLAVMCRLGVEHRVTLDIDSTFDRPSDPPTTAILLAEGTAKPGRATNRIVIGTTAVDVIDTFSIDADALPDDAAERLFVCAHRFAWESGDDITIIGDSASTTIAVATTEALIAMKSHALAFGSRERRRRKRASDLIDFIALVTATDRPILANAPWNLAAQVRRAVTEHLSDHAADAATLRASGIHDTEHVEADFLAATMSGLLDRLGRPPP